MSMALGVSEQTQSSSIVPDEARATAWRTAAARSVMRALGDEVGTSLPSAV
jgi:hypothetical protein